MANIKEKKDCCGCGACANVCNHNAITMVPDVLGFLYPQVDAEKCIKCGLCEKVCSFDEDYTKDQNLATPQFWGVRHKNKDIVCNSRSGGAFVAISDWILSKGGVIYGVGLDEQFCAVHKRAQTKNERDEFCGSKYVQSNLTDCFKHIKEDLKNGLIVLFTGTPCQTSAIRKYLGEKLTEKLYLLDIICHGVPSPAIWKDNIRFIEHTHKSKVSSVNFRNKIKYGWNNHVETYTINGKIISSWAFTDLFYKHLILRESCANCHFANLTRPSDITIGDFWGADKVCPHFNEDNLGVSLLICNTVKGIELFDDCKKNLSHSSISKNDCLQPNLISPTKFNQNYEKFVEDYTNKGYYYVYCKYGIGGLKNKIKKFFYIIYVRVREFKNLLLELVR